MRGSGYWRTEKQTEPFDPGKNATEYVNEYVRQWKARCYAGGIPDEVPRKVEASMRAPSWRAVALAILKNDHTFGSLGFAADTGRADFWVTMGAIATGRGRVGQIELDFDGR